MISRLSRTNVLAIRCVEDLVLVGMGPILYVFQHSKICENYKLRDKLDCLYPNNVHGIVVGPNNRLAVFGAKSICICDIVKQKEEITLEKQSTDQLDDWIIAVEWISVNKQMQLAILLAHNYLCIYDLFDRQSSRIVHCKEKCILYGGSISGTCQENLVVFSGTVFQEILIWKMDNNYEIMPVLHRLAGHKGVIFSVIYDPCSRLICSTSDDRSVRFWRVTNSETADGNNLNWQSAKIAPVKTMFVHTARVWKAVIRDDIVVTIGEDSLMCTWSLSGNLLNKVLHGAPIWSIDISRDCKRIFTGGADGSVYMWPTTRHVNPKIISLPNNVTFSNPKCISYLRNGTLLIFDESGTLFCYDKERTLRTKYFLCSELRRSYYIMQVSPNRSFVAFASREGYVTIYRDSVTGHVSPTIEERLMESQIFSLHWLKHTSLIACGANGLLTLFTFTIDVGIRTDAQFVLPPSRERWLTAATIYEELLLICGDRAGNVYVFKLNEQANQNIEKPVQILNRVHGKIGVQSFARWEEKLMTTGRDGMLRFYELGKEDARPLSMLHRKKMPIDWISGMLKTADGHCTPFICGFKEVEFIIYNLSTESILIRIPCGGGHRSWDCMISDEITSFIYIQNKQIYIFDYPLSSAYSPVLQNGFHIKETYCLQHIARLGTFKQDIIISGGEDCTLRISSICESFEDNPHSVFHNLGNFDGHLSGIKCISTIKLHDKTDDLNSKYLVFSGGGRAQLKIWEIRLKDKDWILSSDLSCSDIKSHMLYGQDRYRRKPWQEAKPSYVIEPEARYMDIYAYYPSENGNHVLIFVACADGYLRLFVYNIQTSDIYLKVSTKHIDRCILKMHVLSHKSKVTVLTMTTDGTLRFFNFTDLISKIYKDANNENQAIIEFSDDPFAEFILHQSGINSFDLKHMDEDKYLLVTGGDDNLLNLVCFQLCISENETLSAVTLSKWKSASAHSAQITGLKFKDDQICSVGIDQQVIVHSYSWSHGVISANILNQIFTSVTDVQGLFLWPSNDGSSVVCVYGRGFEILSI